MPKCVLLLVVGSDDVTSMADVSTQSAALATCARFRHRRRRVDVSAAEFTSRRWQRQEEEID